MVGFENFAFFLFFVQKEKNKEFAGKPTVTSLINGKKISDFSCFSRFS